MGIGLDFDGSQRDLERLIRMVDHRNHKKAPTTSNYIIRHFCYVTIIPSSCGELVYLKG